MVGQPVGESKRRVLPAQITHTRLYVCVAYVLIFARGSLFESPLVRTRRAAAFY